jgi:hypothetical protein
MLFDNYAAPARGTGEDPGTADDRSRLSSDSGTGRP